MRRTVFALVAVIVVAGGTCPVAHAGEFSWLLPVEVTVDPPAPAQGDDVTVTVVAEPGDIPSCQPFDIGIVVGPAPEAGYIALQSHWAIGGTATATFELPSIVPGEYAAFATCAEAAVAYEDATAAFTVAPGSGFTMSASPTGAVAGTSGEITVTGSACWSSSVAVRVQLRDVGVALATSTVEVAADGSWSGQLTWRSDLPAGTYEIRGVCGDQETHPLQLVDYDPVAFTLTAPAAEPQPQPQPQPPAPPVAAPADFTG